MSRRWSRVGLTCAAAALALAACLAARSNIETGTSPDRCKPLPPKGVWFHTTEDNSPTGLRMSYVEAASGERYPLLVLSSEGGARYDLCNDRWSRIEPSQTGWASYPLPLPVRGGRELFFVGPSSADDPFGYFLRFNLDEGKWHSLPKEGAPSSRRDSWRAWAGDRFIVVGGNPVDGAAFNLTSHSWEPIAAGVSGPIEGVASVGTKLLLWPQNVLYDVPTSRWVQAPAEAPSPYQPEVLSDGHRAVVFGGISGSAEGGEYDAARSSWRPLPAFKPTEPIGYRIRFVNGNLALVPWHYELSNAPQPPEDPASFVARCPDTPLQYFVLDRSGNEWKPVRLNETGNGFCAQLVTATGILLIHLSPYNPEGFVEDGVIWAIDGRTGALRKAVFPKKGAPTSPGMIRWDGTALWVWRATTFSVSGDPNQCRNHAPNMGCDPVATTTETEKPGAWRLEPDWVDAGSGHTE